jgi:branched-chain amino acid transport system ATP-binding protein
MSQLKVRNLGIAFGGLHAVQDLSFEIRSGSIHSIIGPNGAGKTTLFNMITGVYTPTSGEILFEDKAITGKPPHALAASGISRTFQNLQIFFRMTALENVMVGRHLHENRNVLTHLFRLPAVLRQERETREASRRLLDKVGLGDHANTQAGAMPYGALKRLEIARALATEPKMLLLDEPAAGCNPVETRDIDRLIQDIAADGVTVVLVEHDMHLVMNISDHILVLDYGRKLAEGTAAEVRNNPDVVAAYLGAHGEEEYRHAHG